MPSSHHPQDATSQPGLVAPCISTTHCLSARSKAHSLHMARATPRPARCPHPHILPVLPGCDLSLRWNSGVLLADSSTSAWCGRAPGTQRRADRVSAWTIAASSHGQTEMLALSEGAGLRQWEGTHSASAAAPSSLRLVPLSTHSFLKT